MATATVKKTNLILKEQVPKRLAPELFTPQLDLSARDVQFILSMMEKPPKPNAKMKRAAARYNRLMGKKS
jgi:uncharacterized protein (DUF1778 family)